MATGKKKGNNGTIFIFSDNLPVTMAISPSMQKIKHKK